MKTPNKRQIATDIYKNAKQLIKNVADSGTLTDKGYRRYYLNGMLDDQTRQINFYLMKERITKAQAREIIFKLENYVIKRHDK